MKIKRPPHSFYFLIALLAISSYAFGQNFNFRNYSLDDGLSQSEINCIYDDSRGYLWMGTSGGGLNRFDGSSFKAYEEKDGVCSQIITAITEDPSGNLWIGSQQGSICIFNGKSFIKINDSNKDGFIKGKIVFITIDDNKNVLIGKEDGLYFYPGNKLERISATEDTTTNYTVNCFKKDSRNITWIGTSKGVFVLKNRSLIRISGPDLSRNMNITSITEDINGNLWAIKDNKEFFKIRIVGPSHYQVSVTKIDSIQLPFNTEIASVHFDKRNQLWVASSNKGIIKVENNSYSHFNQQSGLSVENIKNIFEDASGNLWFGTSGGGLIRFTNQAFAYFDNLEGFNSPDIFAINADKDNNIWVGTQLHGVFRFDGKRTISAGPFINDEVRSIYTDRKGVTWFGSSSGIFMYNGKTFSKFKGTDSLKNIRAIYEDSKGNLWIGTKGNGIYIYTDKKDLRKLENPQENAYAFVEDAKGNIWIGTGAGIFVYNNEKQIGYYSVSEGMCNSYAGSLACDKFGNIWVGTDNCVARFDGKKFKSYGVEEGLTSGTVYLINADSIGNIWVGTNKGLDKIALNEQGEIESFRNYGKAEGFKGIECNSRATCTDRNGNLWFGTIKGAIKFNPREDINTSVEIPVTHINGIKIFYEEVDWTKYSDSISTWFNVPYEATLPYNKNQITFEFSAISKTFPDAIKYSFMLEGFDNDWSPPDDNHSASYSNLPPATYTFKVRSINKSGIRSEREETFTFTVSTPFWKAWWFILLIISGGSGMIYFYNIYRKRKHELHKERLEKIIRERTSEILKQRDEKEILLKEVHHRVKNNLQIINSLINIQSDYVNDPGSLELFKEIRNRIRTISLVHEKLYKSQDYANINVKEYINMLVENLIDTYNFDKNIELRINLQVEYFNLNTIIPLGLLLNEVISNSFKYAFNDTQEGVIEISLEKYGEERYILIIGDNGTGFDHDPFTGESTTLGLELVRILSDQLNGKIEKLKQKGTYYRLEFKPLKD
ncbi:MAG TPA: two-component regulator propeller domain-containing protein [Bacteroidia bacterium]